MSTSFSITWEEKSTIQTFNKMVEKDASNMHSALKFLVVINILKMPSLASIW